MNSVKSKNIIVFVDDEKICHTWIELIIPNLTNFELVSAFNGTEAIRVAEENSEKICLMLVDLVLPDINGYDIFKLFQKNKKLAKIPFIFQSGLSDQEQELNKNVDKDIKILYKPYNKDMLLQSINEMLV